MGGADVDDLAGPSPKFSTAVHAPRHRFRNTPVCRGLRRNGWRQQRYVTYHAKAYSQDRENSRNDANAHSAQVTDDFRRLYMGFDSPWLHHISAAQGPLFMLQWKLRTASRPSLLQKF
jgi:hypothetical protein